jgi:anti-sigma factor ChrR (cupin superfamily)
VRENAAAVLFQEPDMLVNADFSRRAVVAPEDYRWVPSPQPGVERVMLDRIGGEIARATSIVSYAPRSRFPAHSHGGGEEILVLSGTFSDEGGHFPAGWYLRNPPGSRHQPASEEGAVIFVKLGQQGAAGQAAVRIDTSDPSRWEWRDGREVCPLFSAPGEEVSLLRLAAGEAALAGTDAIAGAEVLVVRGSLAAPEGTFAAGTWIRLPCGDSPALPAGPDGATVYLKTGHLAGM